jgi:phytoene dehydrogenase-like protein
VGRLWSASWTKRLRYPCGDRVALLVNGAWYPAGGAGEIAKATGAVIRAAGGDLLPNHEVTRILLEGDRAVGVEVNIKQEG